jgi:hypothetical protein
MHEAELAAAEADVNAETEAIPVSRVRLPERETDHLRRQRSALSATRLAVGTKQRLTS